MPFTQAWSSLETLVRTSLGIRINTWISFGSRTVQFSSAPWPNRRGGGWGHEGRFRRDPIPVFSAGGPCEQLWHGQEWRIFYVVHLAFPLPTTASPTLQGVLKDIFVEAVVGVTCKFSSLDARSGPTRNLVLLCNQSLDPIHKLRFHFSFFF